MAICPHPTLIFRDVFDSIFCQCWIDSYSSKLFLSNGFVGIGFLFEKPCFRRASLAILSLFASGNHARAVYAVAPFGHAKWTKINFGFLLAALLGLASTLLCPGNAIRKAAEIPIFFPNFEKVGFLERLVMIFIETSDILFAQTYLFIILFLLVLIGLACCKRRYVTAMLAFVPLGVIVADYWNVLGLNILDNMTYLTNTAKHKLDLNLLNVHTIRYSLFYLFLYFLIGLATFLVFKDKKRSLRALYFLVAGFATRMALVMSATMFASENRTLVPFVLVTFIVSIYFLQEFFETKKETNRLKLT